MPKPRKPYRNRRKYAGKKNRYGNRKVRVPLNFGQPQSMMVKMRYSEQISIDPGAAGAIAGAIYRANGLFDPSVTFAGTQPLSYDSWLGNDGTGALYKEFCVLGSMIKVEFIATTSNQQNRVGITVQDSTGVHSTAAIANQSRATVKGILGTFQGNGVKTLSAKFSAKKWFRHKTITDERDTHGTFGADPSRQAYFQVWAEGLGTDTTAISALVTIDYIVLLREPAQLPAS